MKSGLPETWPSNPLVGANIIARITAALVANLLAKFGVTTFFLLCWLNLQFHKLNIGDWSSLSPCLSRGTFVKSSWSTSSGPGVKTAEPTSMLELQTSGGLESSTQKRSRTCGEEPKAPRASVAPTLCICRVTWEWITSSWWSSEPTDFDGMIPSCKYCWPSGSCLRVLPGDRPSSASAASAIALPISPWLADIIRPRRSFRARQSPCHDLLRPPMSWYSSHRPGPGVEDSSPSPSVLNIPCLSPEPQSTTPCPSWSPVPYRWVHPTCHRVKEHGNHLSQSSLDLGEPCADGVWLPFV